MRQIFSILLSLFRRKSIQQSYIERGVLCFCLCCVSVVQAQRPLQDDLRPSVMERLDESEAVRLLAFFKAQQIEGDFCFHFQLRHKPRRGGSVNYEGILYGSRNKEGPISRFKLYPNEINDGLPMENRSPIEMIVQNGFSPKVWVRHQNSGAFTLVTDDSLFEPIFEGVLYTPFDLQMPFVFWDDYKYEGPTRVLSRIGQRFRMLSPEKSLAERNGVTAVRIFIDDTYCALLRAEVLLGGETRSQFTVRGIKKIQDRYIVKEVELKDMETKDATTFRVKAAAIGLKLKSSIFDPEAPEDVPEISAIALEEL